MNAVVAYDRRDAASYTYVGFGSGGGDVDNVLERLGKVEDNVSELRTEVKVIAAIIPALATKEELKAEIGDLRTEMATEFGRVRAEMAVGFGSIRAEMATEFGRVRAEMAAGFGSIRAETATEFGKVRTEIADVKTAVASIEGKIVKWFIATGLTSATLAFSIAKLVH